ncbi:TetR/AcrR family transcriptional regulator [Novosphingobium sp. BL-52-GroH]|uniref:TetR/AcrR family transcriptional regulator n=1 Tax=Novosphingobium sp. BL-52-GroH TaxID=3349877 RepID=UPI00384BABC0
MSSDKAEIEFTNRRGEPVRQRVLDAAERLLRGGKAEFSMRDLASEAGVSFATPFNQFGSKGGIMNALSARRINAMAARFEEAPPLHDAAGRIALAIDIAVTVMLEESVVNRAVMGWVGTASAPAGNVISQSSALWARALGDGSGLATLRGKEALRTLPMQLALAFRGALSFWTAGELTDQELGPAAQEIAGSLLRGFFFD